MFILLYEHLGIHFFFFFYKIHTIYTAYHNVGETEYLFYLNKKLPNSDSLIEGWTRKEGNGRKCKRGTRGHNEKSKNLVNSVN